MWKAQQGNWKFSPHFNFNGKHIIRLSAMYRFSGFWKLAFDQFPLIKSMVLKLAALMLNYLNQHKPKMNFTKVLYFNPHFAIEPARKCKWTRTMDAESSHLHRFFYLHRSISFSHQTLTQQFVNMKWACDTAATKWAM